MKDPKGPAPYARILVHSGSRATDRPFDYLVPEALQAEIKVGSLVSVPFGRGGRLVSGLVVDLHHEKPPFRLKSVAGLIPGEAPLSKEGLALVGYLVESTLSDYSSAIQAVTAPGPLGSYRPKIQSFFRLSAAGHSAIPPKQALRQAQILTYLKKEGEEEQGRLLQATGASTQTLRSMQEKGWLIKGERRMARRTPPKAAADPKKRLNSEQEAIYQEILKETGTYLICGVTGSGKTEIYLQLVEEALGRGKEAIILVPEISLTPQTIARFEGRFGRQVAMLHSRLSTAERYEEWEKIRTGEARIAVGARSAIFAPFQNLGLIVIDEEHESSYVSEQAPKYHVYDVARFRSQYHDCSLVLGSATPSMERLYEADQGLIHRLDLKERVGQRPMPTVEIVDMREELKANNRTMFSRALYQAISEALSKKEQVILFLNKRGHTSFVFCRTCGYTYRCDACDVALTYHKGRDRLICHYCGRSKRKRSTCPNCGSQSIKEFGAGTEQLEEEAQRLFPEARIRRADADTMTQKGAYDTLYREMRTGQVDLLLGTQMIAKGFDFPNVTVVGVMAADISLNFPDIRASERTFQLLTQVAGRAGRGERPGRVFIQTYKADHPAIVLAAQNDVDGFYRWELSQRQREAYPPFTHTLYIRLSGGDRARTLQEAQKLRAFVEEHKKEAGAWKLEGPTPSVIERMDRQYRFGLIVRSENLSTIRGVGQAVMEHFPGSQAVRVAVMIDPISIF